MANTSNDSNSQAEQKTIIIPSATQPTSTSKKLVLSLAKLTILVLTLAAIGLSIYNLLLTKHLEEKNQLNWEQKFHEIEQTLRQYENQALQRETEISRVEQQVAILSQIKDNNAWQLQEVNYLLQLADLNLKYQHDPATAINLLTLADEKIARLNQPQFNQLRQMLSRDIASIRVVQAIDVTGILAKLQTMSERLKTLPVIIDKQELSANSTQPAANQSIGAWWQKALEQIRQVLQRLIVIHHYDETTKPLVTKDQQYLLATLIHFHLSQAQWAALHYDQDLFQQNLQRAKELIQMTFGTSSEKTALLTECSELQQINLAVAMPELGNTMASIPQLQQDNTKPPLPMAKVQPNKPEKSTLQESALV